VALSTYAELQTSIGSWLARSDLTASIPDFITLFETRFTRKIRVRQMESRTNLTISDQYTDLPTGFLEMRQLKLLTDPTVILRPAPPQYIGQVYAGSLTDQPIFYSIIGNEIMVGPQPDVSYTAEASYYSFTKLSVSATTNWLLTSHPDIYLFGSLVAAEAFIMNDERVAGWKSMLDEAMMELTDKDWDSRYGGPLIMVSDTGNP
jgi:hypothetical protein